MKRMALFIPAVAFAVISILAYLPNYRGTMTGSILSIIGNAGLMVVLIVLMAGRKKRRY